MGRVQALNNVVSDLRRLADSLKAAADIIDQNGPAPEGTAVKEETGLPEAPDPAREARPAAKALTLEQVRAVLAEKSRQGFTAEVRALLEKYGAPKLSRIDPANYAALLADAEALQ